MKSIINEFKSSYKSDKPIKVYESSMSRRNGCIFLLIREHLERKLVIIYSESKRNVISKFIFEKEGDFTFKRQKLNYIICPCNSENASMLRKLFTFMRPHVIGLTPAIGLGDRLGLSTPGHIRAVKGFNVFPVLAQQSHREMERAQRTYNEVLNDASWAVFQEGYRGGFVADADHLKREEELNAAFKAGFTMYTVDPSDHIDLGADHYDYETLRDRFATIPWGEMGCRKERFLRVYLSKKLVLQEQNGKVLKELRFSEENLMRTAVKYSTAILFVVRMYRRLKMLFKYKRFDFEVSIDEVEKPTSTLEHFFIISELKRLGVKVQSLAPRFVGKFEKAIDYVGDLKDFAGSFNEHILVSRFCGPYKISIHSGSDKFSIYPIISKIAHGLIHLKTSGTSYLESLRIIARHDPKLFREIVNYSLGCFERDRRSYHVSAVTSLMPSPEDTPDEDLEKVFLESNFGRQILHVTFGSVLTAKDENGELLFRERIKRILIESEEEFYEVIATHIRKHLKECLPQA